jgi:dynactin-5
MIFELRNSYEPDTFFETKSGAKIHRKNNIMGSANIHLAGKELFLENIVIRGDYSYIYFGQLVALLEGVTVRPAYRRHKDRVAFLPLNVADYTTIGEHSIVQAAEIGSFVSIGRNCVVGNRAIIQDQVQLLDDSVVPPDAVLTSQGLYGGTPARWLAELPDSWCSTQKVRALNLYNSYVVRAARKTLPRKE